MVLTPNMPGIIEAMERHEAAMSELYQAYAQRFPELSEFFMLMAMEEMIHADTIQYLQHKIREGAAHSARHNLKLDVINRSCDYIREETARARSSDLLPINALSIALSLEKAILERKIFEVFVEDSAEVADLLRKLIDGVDEHIKRVEDVWHQHREMAR